MTLILLNKQKQEFLYHISWTRKSELHNINIKYVTCFCKQSPATHELCLAIIYKDSPDSAIYL